MDDIRLPQHVLNRIEQRWTARLAQMLEVKRPLGERPLHLPTEITIHFDHRKFGGCWKGP
jgi:hypothetical protein